MNRILKSLFIYLIIEQLIFIYIMCLLNIVSKCWLNVSAFIGYLNQISASLASVPLISSLDHMDMSGTLEMKRQKKGTLKE